jgi:pimeloyl-ACP methyl ester carboxylesterase
MQHLRKYDQAWSTIDGLRVVTVGDRAARRQVLLFMGLSACVEPFELQRSMLLAATWDAQLTVVDVPGYGYGGAQLTSTERHGLRRGHFTAVARRMVRTAQRHHAALRQSPVTVVGYSMGASLACAAAADPGLLRVINMVLVEPVAMRRWGLLKLIRSVRSEDTVVDDYLENNCVFPDAVLPPERRNAALPQSSRRDLAHLGFALSRGFLVSDLLRSNLIQQFPIEIVHGVDSELSRADEVSRLHSICTRAGMDVLDVPVAGRHALWHSLPDVTALARVTLKE